MFVILQLAVTFARCRATHSAARAHTHTYWYHVSLYMFVLEQRSWLVDHYSAASALTYKPLKPP